MKNKLFDLIKNNKNLILSIAVVGLIAVIVPMFCITIIKKGTFAIETTPDILSVNCPEKAEAGSTISCNVELGSNSMETKGISIKHGFEDDMEFVDFDATDNWDEYVNDKDGFLLINLNGVNGTNVLGTIKYRIPSTATSNDNYRVELIDATIGDGEDKIYKFNNVYDDIRIISDVNTLENITLSSGEGTFDKENKEYNGTVNSDKVTIGVIKTDDNSTISGVGEVNLQYGTNIFNITVTSESGIENIYKVNIYRPYEFSSDIYTYNKQKNYIYTGNDTDSILILSKIEIPSELSANIENNKLNINYGEENLLSIDIINFKPSKYNIEDKIMYIEKNQSYDEFMDSITLNSVIAKVFDTNGNQITDGTILEGYTYKIYYQDNSDPLEVYTFNEEYYRIEELDIDENNKVIKNIELGAKYQVVKHNIRTTGTVRIINKDGIELSENDKINTGDILEIILNGATYTYTMSVVGDVNGDGNIDMNDADMMASHLIKGDIINQAAELSASDMNKDNKLDINDVIKIAEYIKEQK